MTKDKDRKYTKKIKYILNEEEKIYKKYQISKHLLLSSLKT